MPAGAAAGDTESDSGRSAGDGAGGSAGVDGGAGAERGPAEVWEREVRPSLKPLVRAIYSGGSFTRHHGTQWFFAVPNGVHAEKCELHRAHVEQVLSSAVGSPVEIVIEVGSGSAPHPTGDPAGPSDAATSAPSVSTPEHPATPTAPRPPDDVDEAASPPDPPDDDDIDLDELTDAPPEAALSPIDRLAQAFPGAELVDDD